MYVTFYALLFAYIPAVIKLGSCQVSEDDADQSLMVESFCGNSGRCYTVWNFQSALNKWQALQHCIIQNQTLATISSKTDEKRLSDVISNMAWVGLSLFSVTEWKWLSRKDWNIDPSLEEQITDDEPKLPCLIINRERLMSVSCNHDLSHICEFTEQPTDTMACAAPPKKIANRWICIRTLKMEGMNYVDSARRCDRDNGNLLVIANEQELTEVKELLSEISGHYWTAATRVIMEWEEPAAQVNPYSLTWSNITSNPNLDEVRFADSDLFCVYLSDTLHGLTFKRCQDELKQVICSTPSKQTTTTTAITSTADKTVSEGQASTTTINSTSTLHNSTTTSTSASSTVHIVQTLNYTTHKPQSTYVVELVGAPGVKCEEAGVSKERYKIAIIFAYVLAVLLVIAIALLAAIFVWRRRQKRRKSRIFDSTFSRKTYKTLGNGTLGRQRLTDPTEEWDRVMTENDDNMVEMRKKPERHASIDMDIVHNVPLDPRGSVEQPLTVPRESHIVTLQRGKSMESQSSLASGDVATFSIDRASSTTSILKNPPPPVPPKTPCTAAEQGLGLPPPPPPEVLADYAQSTPSPPKHPPPPLDQIDPTENPPTVPVRPAKRPPRKQKKKQPEPDPIYSEIDKSRIKKLPPPPTSPKPRLSLPINGLHTLPPPPPLGIDTAIAPDNYSDSGVDMGVNSPPPNFKNGHMTAPAGDGSSRMAMLDDIVSHMTSS